MYILPRSNPLYENISVQSINLPDAISKLGAGGFTGYLGFGSSSAEGYFIFIKGSLISALMLHGSQRKTGFEAINSLFTHAITEGGIINVYLMTPDIAVCTHAMLHGETTVKQEKVANIDLMTTLGRLKTQQANGTVLFSTPERNAMIFYKEGTTIGFYHDAAKEIERTPTESQKIASLPDALVEVKTAPTAAVLSLQNFLESLNINKLWNTILSRSKPAESKPPSDIPKQDNQVTPSPSASPQTSEHSVSVLKEIVSDLHEIAKAYLGRSGADLVDQLLNNAGGIQILQDSAKMKQFLATLSERAPEIDPEAKVDEMTDLMQSEVIGRLSVE